MKFSKYENYKNSEIDWIGEIPNEWVVKRVKDLGSLQNGISQDASYFGKGTPFISYGNVYNDNINIASITNLANSSSEDQKIYSVKEGDVFFTRTSESVEEIGYSGTCIETIKESVFSGFTIRLRPSKNKIWKGFSKYYFKASSNRNFFVKNINIVTRASLGQGLLNQLSILLPPFDEQVSIANFLDKNIKNINNEILILEQKIEKYIEVKQVLITEAVLRGLDNNVELIDSEIEWIGMIPKHWRINRYKDTFKLLSSGIKIFQDEKSYLSTKSVGSNQIHQVEDEITYSNRPSRANMQPIKNSVWFAKMRFTDKCIIFKNNDFDKYILSTGFAGIQIKKDYIDFVKYYILSSYFKFEKDIYSYGTTQESINDTYIAKLHFIRPPYEEQVEIANYLDEKTSKIDLIVQTLAQKIEVLKEYRKTLINDVVTGKVRVA